MGADPFEHLRAAIERGDIAAARLEVENLAIEHRAKPSPTRAPDIPATGEWPCQRAARTDLPPALVAFLYVLLRDGAAAPGDVEQHAINAGRSPGDTTYTNPHLLDYARSLSTFLLEAQ